MSVSKTPSKMNLMKYIVKESLRPFWKQGKQKPYPNNNPTLGESEKMSAIIRGYLKKNNIKLNGINNSSTEGKKKNVLKKLNTKATVSNTEKLSKKTKSK